MSMGVLLSTIHRNMDEAAASKGEDGARPRLYLFRCGSAAWARRVSLWRARAAHALAPASHRNPAA